MNKTEKILTQFFDYEKEYHIRSLSRAVGIHPNTVISITDSLESESLLVKKKDEETNRVLITPNTENIFYKLKKRQHNIEKIFKSCLVDYLNEELSYPTVILFGSYAKAENTKDSDIDLFILADKKKEFELKKFEKKLDTEIQVFLYNRPEFQKMKKANKELLNNILNGYKLCGYIEVF
jgi:predicted nucleotidyltransferase